MTTKMAAEVAPAQYSRVAELARPKQLPAGFLEDRRSVYWVDRFPPIATNGQTVFVLNPWQSKLADARPVNSGWKGDRLTPLWPVSKGAQKAEATPRIGVLAQHKQYNDYQMDRSVYTVVPESAQKTDPTPRLESLATPKAYRNVNTIEYEGFDWTQCIWPSRVSDAAKKANASERIDRLAEAKNPHRDFLGERPIQWAVSKEALKAAATLRIQQLARPKSRTDNDVLDPYKVSIKAMRARATPRVCELSLPIPRKMRAKKAA